MKNRIIDLVLIVLIVGLFATFFMVDKSLSQKKTIPTPVPPTSTIPQSSTQQAVFPEKIKVDNYSAEGARIKLDFVNATATQETLTVTLSITGLDVANNPDAISNMVCDPNITTKEEVQKTYKSLEGNEGDPIQLTYTYLLKGNHYQTLHAEIDWTIGPCGSYLNGGQSNATPYPAELMTNYHFTFTVPVEF